MEDDVDVEVDRPDLDDKRKELTLQENGLTILSFTVFQTNVIMSALRLLRLLILSGIIYYVGYVRVICASGNFRAFSNMTNFGIGNFLFKETFN